MVPMEIGATHGRRMRKRISRFPRKFVSNASARALLSTRITAWEIRANTRVFFSAVWNFGVPTTLVKLRRPTKPSVPPPVVVLLTL